MDAPKKRCFQKKTTRLVFMMILTFLIFLFEIIFGYITNSMALVADSFHMLSDVVALCVALASVIFSKRSSTKNTFGWVRAEVLGAMANAVFLLALCFSILIESIKRMVVIQEVHNIDMLLIAGGIGLAFNLVGLFLFSHGGHGHSHGCSAAKKKAGHKYDAQAPSITQSNEEPDYPAQSHVPVNAAEGDEAPLHPAAKSLTKTTQGAFNESYSSHADSTDLHGTSGGSSGGSITRPADFSTKSEVVVSKDQLSSQLNMRGIFLHVLGDSLGSAIVIISGLAIKYIPDEEKWKYYLDPAMSVVLVIIMLASTFPLLRESAMILLQTVPTHIHVKDIKERLERTPGVLSVHELHVWQLAGSRVIASVHIQCTNPDSYMEVAERVKTVFHNGGIHSTTVQPEFLNSELREEKCALPCARECGPSTCCGNGHVNAPGFLPSNEERPPQSQFV